MLRAHAPSCTHSSGLYQLPLPAVLGREGSGIIEEVGDGVTDFKKGDKVAYFGPNAYAELVALPADKVGVCAMFMSVDRHVHLHTYVCHAHSFLCEYV